MRTISIMLTLLFLAGCQTITADVAAGQVRDITMTAKNWEFVPNEITVNNGDIVRLKVTSVDVDHGLSIPEFGIKVDLAPGKEETAEFVADKKGEFTFVCSVPCGKGHREMKGTLVVR